MESINDGKLRASSSPLLSASFIVGNSCRPINDFFMYCKSRISDPFACLPLGLIVKNCTEDAFKNIQASPCSKLFTQFWHCLDYNSQMFIYCRSEEGLFYKCLKENDSKYKKALWKGDGPDHEDGIKDDGEFPEEGNIWYKWHVYNYKYRYPKE